MLATIQARRGPFEQLDKSKLLPAEFAVVLSGDPDVPSGRSLYLCFKTNETHRIVSIEDLEEMIARGDFKGDKGDPGKDGANITDARIEKDGEQAGHLIFTLSDGTEKDAGLIDDALARIDEAVQAAEAAAQSEQNAAGAEQRAKGYADSAGQSALDAAESEQAAGEHAQTAQDAADTATTKAGDAETAKTDAETAAGNAQQSEKAAQGYAGTASTAADTATTKASEVAQAAETVATDKQAADKSATDAEASAKMAQSYATGDSGARLGEESDNAKEYARQAAESAKEAAEIAGGDFVRNSEKGVPGGVATLGDDGLVDEAQLPKERVIEHRILTTGWTGEKFPYLYEIEIPGLTETQNVYATAAPGLTEAEINAFADAIITGHHQESGKIVLQAVNKPTAELPIIIKLGGEPDYDTE